MTQVTGWLCCAVLHVPDCSSYIKATPDRLLPGGGAWLAREHGSALWCSQEHSQRRKGIGGNDLHAHAEGGQGANRIVRFLPTDILLSSILTRKKKRFHRLEILAADPKIENKLQNKALSRPLKVTGLMH